MRTEMAAKKGGGGGKSEPVAQHKRLAMGQAVGFKKGGATSKTMPRKSGGKRGC